MLAEATRATRLVLMPREDVFIESRTGVNAGEVMTMTSEYPEPTLLTYVLATIVLVGMAGGFYAQFSEPFSGLPVRFWSRIVLGVGVSSLALWRVVPARLRPAAALIGVAATVVGLFMIIASHVR